MSWEACLQLNLAAHDYNTFGSYVEFYGAFKHSAQEVKNFLLEYKPRLMVDSMSCVGLSLHLMKDLIELDGRYGPLFSLVSCEEMFPLSAEQEEIDLVRDSVKEHVLLCLRLTVGEERRAGYVLMDAGYHLSRPIVVMADGLYPHTGWFVASTNDRGTKEYLYRCIDDRMLAWNVREIKLVGGVTKEKTMKEYLNLIYVEKQFTKYADITEKRSLIFKLKSYVIRGRKGLVAGFFSLVDTKSLIIFHEEDGKRINSKHSIDDIVDNESVVRNELAKVASFMESATAVGKSIDERVDYFMAMLGRYRQLLHDQAFSPDLVEIDKAIEEW